MLVGHPIAGVVVIVAATTLACGCGRSTPQVATSRRTVVEEAGAKRGTPTFADPTRVSGPGPTIPFQGRVRVECRLYDPSITSTKPDGYWYRVASPPWDDRYYAVANTFLNGDPLNGPYTHNTDLSLPIC